MILALDTSGDELLVALVDHGALVAGAVHPGLRHQDWIMKAIADAVGGRLNRVDGVAVARGPGARTGLRVGLAAAAGIAFGRHLQIYPLSSLAVAAQRGVDSGIGGDRRVLALVAVGRGRAYTQEFASDGATLGPTGLRRLETISDIDTNGRDVAAEPALMAQLSVGVRKGVRGGVEALVAAVNQAVSAKDLVNYDQLTGDYGD